MSVLAIIPARTGSRGIPNKNFRELVGMSPTQRAMECAYAAGCGRIVVSSDQMITAVWLEPFGYLPRPPDLAQDDTPMIDVVTHVLAEIPGPEDEIILLVQPTQPLREPNHLQAAMALMGEGARRVVSVTPTDSPDKLLRLNEFGVLVPWGDRSVERRQDARPAFTRDGTVYAWRRDDADPFGWPAVPLIILPEETCALDDPRDWAEAERRLRAREG